MGIWLGISPLFIRKPKVALMWAWAILAIAPSLFLLGMAWTGGQTVKHTWYKDSSSDVIQIMFIFLAGVACDVVFFATNRRLLRSGIYTTSGV